MTDSPPKFFLVLARDRAQSAGLRAEFRQDHIDYWLAQGDVLKVAGAMMSDDSDNAVPVGSSFLLSADSEAPIRELLAGDPFTLKGVFGSDILIQRVRPVIGSWLPDA